MNVTNSLLDEIMTKVLAKIGSAELEDTCPEPKPKLMILTQKHGEACHKLYESNELLRCYQIDCAQLADCDMDPAEYEAVVMLDLTNDALSAIASGHAENDFSRLAVRSILLGKRIYVPNQAIELFSYEATAPKAFYAMMQSKLDFLSSCGVTFCDLNELEAILGGKIATADAMPVTRPTGGMVCGTEISLPKRVVTERDVTLAAKDCAKTILIGEKAIVTDLAKEYARERGISIVRRQPRQGA